MLSYVKFFDVLGVETAQIPCIELQGAPTAATEGVVGLLGMDMTSESYELYKCVKVEGSIYTWKPITRGEDGTSIIKAEVDINGELILTLSDGTTINAGVVKGEKGENGANGVDGADGAGVKEVVINADGELVVTLSNGDTINAGKAKGEQGVSIVKTELNVNHELIVTLSNGTEMNLGVPGYAPFVGTRSEYETAYSLGRILVGTLVVIEDEDSTTGGSSTSAVLGEAILGQMILA